MEIEQGMLFGFDFGPRQNNLQEGPRPVVVIQTDKLNRIAGYGNTIVIPLTRTERPSPTYVRVSPSDQNALTSPSFAICNQVFTVPKSDLGEPLGKIASAELFAIKEALGIVFELG